MRTPTEQAATAMEAVLRRWNDQDNPVEWEEPMALLTRALSRLSATDLAEENQRLEADVARLERERDFNCRAWQNELNANPKCRRSGGVARNAAHECVCSLHEAHEGTAHWCGCGSRWPQ